MAKRNLGEKPSTVWTDKMTSPYVLNKAFIFIFACQNHGLLHSQNRQQSQ